MTTDPIDRHPQHTMLRPTDPTSFAANRFVVDDRVVRVEAVVWAPRLVVLGGVLSRAECEALMADAAPRMDRSLVVNADSSGAMSDATRTSSGMHFDRGTSAVADDLQRRLMGIIGMPIEYGEPLQVLRYGPGEVYEPHFDYFNDDGSPESTLALHGQRIATLICYLADVDRGGATVFSATGFEVRPSQGRAVYFADVHEDGSVDPETLHGGAPVGSGEKWIVTQWCRDRPYFQLAE